NARAFGVGTAAESLECGRAHLGHLLILRHIAERQCCKLLGCGRVAFFQQPRNDIDGDTAEPCLEVLTQRLEELLVQRGEGRLAACCCKRTTDGTNRTLECTRAERNSCRTQRPISFEDVDRNTCGVE